MKPTLNKRYDKVRARWEDKTPVCEECGCDMTGREVIEGNWGWYCSKACLRASEEACGPDVDDRAWERRQMGCDF